MTKVDPPAGYRFGLFEVDVRAAEIRKQGRRLRLRGRPVEILLTLLERPGEVVTREQLRDRLWPADTFVDFDHGLNTAVNKLREGLGEAAGNPRFIETLPRRGYRFIAPVEPIVAAAPAIAAASAQVATHARVPPPAAIQTAAAAIPANEQVSAPAPVRSARPSWQSPWRFAVVAVCFAMLVVVAVMLVNRRQGSHGGAPEKITIAVLPFENLSGDRDQEFFSDGVTEEMIAELGMIQPEHLGVIARTTSMIYKGVPKSAAQIGKELGVTYLLEGSVRRAGTRVRITAQLVDARAMTRRWSDSYERDVTDVLAIQRDVAGQIARSLMPLLTPSPARTARGAPPPFDAYELWMRGRFFREQATEESTRRALTYFQQALAIAPEYSDAHAAISDAYRLLAAPGWEVARPSELFQKAKDAADRALALDRQSPQALAAFAMIRFTYFWDPEGAERAIKEALRVNPSSAQAHQYYSGILTTMRRFDEAVAEARRAVELDPLSATANTTLGVRYLYANRIADAAAQFRKTLEISPGFAVAHWGLAHCHRADGRTREELEQLRMSVQLSGNSAYMRSQLAYGYALANDRAAAEALRRDLLHEAPARYVAPYHIALIAAGLGEREDAIRWLERAFDDRSGWLVFLPVQPEFDALRQTPELRRLLARVKPATSLP
jgi:TolB-like protein/DNA-binding winged helix-turn-helix (wHTH) protein/tetratricopeptide (TPR) repeat protein